MKEEQLSETVGAVKVAVPVQRPGVLLTVTGPLQVIEGAWLSTTVTVYEQEALPQALVAVALTVVVPTGKKLPDAGE